MARTLDRSKGVSEERRWGENIRNAMLMLKDDELVRFLVDNDYETNRLLSCLETVARENKLSAKRPTNRA